MDRGIVCGGDGWMMHGGVREGAGTLTGQAGHVDAVGAADEGDDAVGGGRGGEEGEEEDVLGVHFGWVGGWFLCGLE